MTGTSSARPDKLQAYPGAVVDMDDALDRVAGTLDDRLEAFESGAGSYATGFDPHATGQWIRSIADESRHLADWVDSVGRAFEDAGRATGLVTMDDSELSKLVGEPTLLEAERAAQGQEDAAELRDAFEAAGIDPYDFDIEQVKNLDPDDPAYMELFELMERIGEEMWSEDYAVGFYDQMNPDGMQATMSVIEMFQAQQHYSPTFTDEYGQERVAEPPELDGIQENLLDPFVHGWAIASGSVDLDEERRALLSPDDDINGDGRWEQHQLAMWISDEGRNYDPVFLAEAADLILVTQAATNYPNLGYGSSTDPGELTYPPFGPGVELWDDPEMAFNELLAMRALADNTDASFEYMQLDGGDGRLERLEPLLRPDTYLLEQPGFSGASGSPLDHDVLEELMGNMEQYGADIVDQSVVRAVEDDPLRYDAALDIYADMVRAGGDGDVPDVTKVALANAFALYMESIGSEADLARELNLPADEAARRDFNRVDLVNFFKELGYDPEAAAQLGEAMSVWSATASVPLLEPGTTEGDVENAYRDLTLVLAAMEDGFQATGDAMAEAHAGFIKGLEIGGALLTAVSLAAIPVTGGASVVLAGGRSLSGPLLSLGAGALAGDVEGEPISPGELQRSVTQPLRESLAHLVAERDGIPVPPPGEWADLLSDTWPHGDPVEYLAGNSTISTVEYEADEHW